MQTLDDALLVLLTEPGDHIQAACVYPKSYPHLEAALTEVCRVFLVGDSDQRKAIQAKVRGPEMGWYILRFVAEKVREIVDPSDGDELLTGLAAVGLGGAGLEPREADTLLQQLYSAARTAGIDPHPLFLRVAEISSTDKGFYGSSPSDSFRAIAEGMRKR